MSDYVTLMGADDVRTAGYRMSCAAEEIKGAASSVSFALEQHQRFLDDWLSRFEAMLEEKLTQG